MYHKREFLLDCPRANAPCVHVVGRNRSRGSSKRSTGVDGKMLRDLASEPEMESLAVLVLNQPSHLGRRRTLLFWRSAFHLAERAFA